MTTGPAKARRAGAAPPESLPQRKRRRPRGEVTPGDMITSAFELADRVGLSEMSMPQLARHMNVPVTSIYWYFRTRDNLLNAMLDRAIQEHHFANPFHGGKAPWDEALKIHFRHMRNVFRDNPLLCDLVLLRSGELGPESGHAAVEKLESVVAALIDAGFSSDHALEVYLALSVHSRGSAILEHLEATHRRPERLLRDRVGTTGVSAESTPLLHDLAIRGHTVVDVNFEFTLNAIIDRAKHLLAQDISFHRSET